MICLTCAGDRVVQVKVGRFWEERPCPRCNTDAPLCEVACPFCGARSGEPCRTSGGRITVSPHKIRVRTRNRTGQKREHD